MYRTMMGFKHGAMKNIVNFGMLWQGKVVSQCADGLGDAKRFVTSLGQLVERCTRERKSWRKGCYLTYTQSPTSYKTSRCLLSAYVFMANCTLRRRVDKEVQRSCLEDKRLSTTLTVDEPFKQVASKGGGLPYVASKGVMSVAEWTTVL